MDTQELFTFEIGWKAKKYKSSNLTKLQKRTSFGSVKYKHWNILTKILLLIYNNIT